MTYDEICNAYLLALEIQLCHVEDLSVMLFFFNAVIIIGCMCSRLSCAKWQVSGQAALCCVKILKHKTIFQRNANLNVFVLTWIK